MMMASLRASEAESERDAAIEEVALAIFALQRVQKELDGLKRSVFTTSISKPHDHSCCCCSDENQEDELHEHSAGKFAELEFIQRRNDQILWHVGHIAEAIWEAMRMQSRDNEEEHVQSANTAGIQTLSDVKVAVLEQFQTLLPKDETYLYEEMHVLYTEAARREKLRERMADQIQTLLHKNGDLETRVQALEDRVKIAEQRRQQDVDLRSDLVQQTTQDKAETDSILEQKFDEIRDLQQRLNEKDNQIKQLLKMVEIQTAVISSEPTAHHEDQACNFHDEHHATTETVLENHGYYDEYDEFEASIDGFQHQSLNLSLLNLDRSEVEHASSSRESQRVSTRCEEEKTNLQDKRDLGSAETACILQAQLKMYVQYFQRKNAAKR